MSYKSRAEVFGYYMVEHGATIRSTAEFYGVSKSTVHYDLMYKLKQVNPYLYCRVRCVIEDNLRCRHLRGGDSTRRKYMAMRLDKGV
jgi:putative DeoR family transcriptional regulator (stage III sporulation protein D)